MTDKYFITDTNRQAIIEWLQERSQFHIWFTSLITASFIILTVFGNKPGFNNPSQQFLSIALIMLLFAMLCNFVSVWAIPGWKLKILTGQISHTKRLYIELSINTWLAVVLFTGGLTFGFIGNIPL